MPQAKKKPVGAAISDELNRLRDQVAHEVAKLREKLSAVVRAIGDLEKERDRIMDAPLDRDDIKDFIVNLIDQRAATYPKLSGMQDTFFKLMRPCRGPGDANAAAAVPLSLRSADSELNRAPGESSIYGLTYMGLFADANGIMRNSETGMLFFFGDVIKAKLLEQFDQLVPALPDGVAEHVGPPVAERRARLAAITAELRGLTEQRDAIESQITGMFPAVDPIQPARKPTLKMPTRLYGARQDDSYYNEADVLTVTGWESGDLDNAIASFDFPQVARNTNGQRLWSAREVESWVIAYARDATE